MRDPAQCQIVPGGVGWLPSSAAAGRRVYSPWFSQGFLFNCVVSLVYEILIYTITAGAGLPSCGPSSSCQDSYTPSECHLPPNPFPLALALGVWAFSRVPLSWRLMDTMRCSPLRSNVKRISHAGWLEVSNLRWCHAGFLCRRKCSTAYDVLVGSAKTTVSLLCRMYEVLSRARIFSVGTTLAIMLQNENESSSTGFHLILWTGTRH